jgi:antitoxin (DNA-binding transcriptional repressor) of toxin-antitoxin stability system
MKFATIREFRSKTAAMRRELQRGREIILTANGRPIAIVSRVDADSLEDELTALRRARARIALDRIGADAKSRGLDKMTMAEIDALIAKVRRAKRSPK